jgi:hypothetical protein
MMLPRSTDEHIEVVENRRKLCVCLFGHTDIFKTYVEENANIAQVVIINTLYSYVLFNYNGNHR